MACDCTAPYARPDPPPPCFTPLYPVSFYYHMCASQLPAPAPFIQHQNYYLILLIGLSQCRTWLLLDDKEKYLDDRCTLQGALVMPLMARGLSKGIIKFNLITAQKPS